MKRRDMLLATGAAALGLTTFPLRWASAKEDAKNAKKKKILYFTRSAGFEHSVVRRKGDQLSHSEQVLTSMGAAHDAEVVCSKDGRLFDGDLDQYDAIAFYTSGDLTRENKRGTPPMTLEGKQKLLDWVAAGGGFVAFHAATDSFHSPGGRGENQALEAVDPYLKMVGGEFVTHGPQQKATMKIVSPKFPGVEKLGTGFEMLEEWYALKNFNPDIHVILVQETAGMKGGCYQRPSFPATWARLHGKGRVFHTTLGHREDVWTSPTFQQIVGAGFCWVTGGIDADISPNIEKVAPKAHVMTNA